MSDDLEQRLRDTLRAYADVVDDPGDGTLPVQSAPSPRRWRAALLAAAAAAAVVIGSLVIVDLRETGADPVAGSAVASSVSPRGGTPTEAPESAGATASDQALSGDAAAAAGVALPPSPQVGVPYAIELYTHCGVRGLDVNGSWFAADPPLVEDYGPPTGWGNPDQRGTLTLLSATEAVFADDAGHLVRLRADESARPPLCA